MSSRLDVNDVITDPDFADVFTVIRRDNVIDEATGRGTVVPVTVTGVVGVVIIEDPSDLVRLDDSQSVPRRIDIVTPYRLRSAMEAAQPDQVVYMSSTYTVVEIKHHTRWGRGFVKAKALSRAASDPTPE